MKTTEFTMFMFFFYVYIFLRDKPMGGGYLGKKGYWYMQGKFFNL